MAQVPWGGSGLGTGSQLSGQGTNSEAQKPEKSPTHSLFWPGSGLVACCLVQQMLFLPLTSTVPGARSTSPLSHPRTKQHLFPHLLLSTSTQPVLGNFN